MKVKEEREKVDLKFNIQTTKIMACSPITSWEIDVFLELSCFLHETMDVGSLISGSSAFSKSRLNIWKFSVYKLLKSILESFGYFFVRV